MLRGMSVVAVYLWAVEVVGTASHLQNSHYRYSRCRSPRPRMLQVEACFFAEVLSQTLLPCGPTLIVPSRRRRGIRKTKCSARCQVSDDDDGRFDLGAVDLLTASWGFAYDL